MMLVFLVDNVETLLYARHNPLIIHSPGTKIYKEYLGLQKSENIK